MLRPVRLLARLTFLAACALAPSAAMAAMPFVDMQTESQATYDAVQTLYDRYVIFDNGTHLFNPRSLIARDDFTSIVMEVGCERCLQPTPDVIFAYTSRVFEDVWFDNENFYCIARAESLGVVRGYVLDESGTVSCQDKTVHSSVPFCPVNNITRIEAAAVLLRHAGFWDETRNANAYDRRYAISDTSEYWYGYAMRALDFELFPIDASGRVSPNEYINRAEFARMAAKILRSRICDVSGADIDDRFRTSRGNAVTRYPGNSNGSATNGMNWSANNGTWNGSNGTWSGGGNSGNGSSGSNSSNGNGNSSSGNNNGNGNGSNANNGGNSSDGNNGGNGGSANNGNGSNNNANNGNNGGNGFSSGVNRTVSLTAGVSYNSGTSGSTVGTANLSTVSSASEDTYRWTLRSLSGETRSYSGSSLSWLDLCRSVWLGHVEAVSPAGVVDATADVQVACPSIAPPTSWSSSSSGSSPSSGSGSDSGQCTSGTCACPAGFTCSTTDSRVCSTAGRCNPVNAISVAISANPFVPMVRENISFSGSVSGGVGPYSYSWDFADGTVRSLTGAATSVSGGALRATSNPTHSYGTTGARLVQLSVRDSAGNVGYASVSVLVRENDDYDGDWVRNNGDGTPDSSDLCPYVYGPASRRGCPVVPAVDTSGSDVTTSHLFPGDPCRWTQLSGRAYMLGTVAACASCPCRYRADFASGLAVCDTVVPAIMSPDKQTIYSRGNPYEILPGR